MDMENKSLENITKREGLYNGFLLLGNGIFGGLSGLSTGYLVYKLEQPDPTVIGEIVGALTGFTVGTYLYKKIAERLYKPYKEYSERFLNGPEIFH